MVSTQRGKGFLLVAGLTGLILACPKKAFGQVGSDGAATQKSSEQMNIVAVGKMIQQLQSQVQDLTVQVKNLEEQQQSALAESAELRKELEATRSQLVSLFAQAPRATSLTASQGNPPEPSIEDRITKLEESQQLASAEVAEQSQTKVESNSKYRLRLSGIALFNAYVNRGSVNNQDYPAIATAPGPLGSSGTFGGSLRQSQIGLEAFGPTIAGARTSAKVQFDFAGGFPNAPNGVSFGLMRLRTGTVRFEWDNTSVIAGQDSLFIAPLSPTSIATLAIPAFAYSGNLWSWTPQFRMEHRFRFSERSSLLLQGGLLDSLTGEFPASGYNRYPTAGESSGQPAMRRELPGRNQCTDRILRSEPEVITPGRVSDMDGRSTDGPGPWTLPCHWAATLSSPDSSIVAVQPADWEEESDRVYSGTQAFWSLRRMFMVSIPSGDGHN